MSIVVESAVFFSWIGLILMLLVASIISKRCELVFAALGMIFLQSTIQGLVSVEDVSFNWYRIALGLGLLLFALVLARIPMRTEAARSQ